MILSLIIAALSFFVGAYLLKGVEVKGFLQALLVAVVVAILDVTVGNVLRIATLGLLTLGIFSWLLNAILIQIADWFLPSFTVKNFWWALALAAVVSISTSILQVLI